MTVLHWGLLPRGKEEERVTKSGEGGGRMKEESQGGEANLGATPKLYYPPQHLS